MNSTLRKWTSLIALIGLLTTAIAPVTASAQSRYAPEWLIKPIAKPQMQVIAPSWLVEQEELLEDGSEDLVYEDETEEIDEEELAYDEESFVEEDLSEYSESEEDNLETEEIADVEAIESTEDEVQENEVQDDEEILYAEDEIVEEVEEEQTPENGYAIEDESELLALATQIRELDPSVIVSRLLNRHVPVETIIELFRYMTEDAEELSEIDVDAEDVIVESDDELVLFEDEELVSDEEAEEYAVAIDQHVSDNSNEQLTFLALLEQLSDMYEQKGVYQNVIKVQQQVVKTQPSLTDAYVKLNRAYQKLGDKTFKLFVNGEKATLDAPPVVVKGRSLLPFRPISESLEAEVKWNAAEQSVTMSRNGQMVKLIIGKSIAYVNKKPVKLDAPAMIHEGRTIVPVRFLGEALETEVQWQPASRALIIFDRNA
jgi:hypothetical protein